ncbi:dsc e3 ubiquitin ligase complex subunit 4 [Anaeramoeba flamelloides]|uniref:Dsc e3 ubiquitin ligase complex subunit 4 n=1 Tax=Anaeramoeba flamelloides TaxID=1746091 RepID=A0ABQ8XDA4_9EUKA|nr:dsc e3 ubiquitin ligase complex subunit 4 [Anaeramoeba flamelloides]
MLSERKKNKYIAQLLSNFLKIQYVFEYTLDSSNLILICRALQSLYINAIHSGVQQTTTILILIILSVPSVILHILKGTQSSAFSVANSQQSSISGIFIDFLNVTPRHINWGYFLLVDLFIFLFQLVLLKIKFKQPERRVTDPQQQVNELINWLT